MCGSKGVWYCRVQLIFGTKFQTLLLPPSVRLKRGRRGAGLGGAAGFRVRERLPELQLEPGGGAGRILEPRPVTLEGGRKKQLEAYVSALQWLCSSEGINHNL